MSGRKINQVKFEVILSSIKTLLDPFCHYKYSLIPQIVYCKHIVVAVIVITIGKRTMAAASKSPPLTIRSPRNQHGLYLMVQEVISGVQTQELAIQSLKSILKLAHDKHKREIVNALVDVLFQCEIETSIARRKEQRELYVNFLRSLVKNEVISDVILYERFEFDTLAQLGFVRDKKIPTTSYNRLRTRLYFKQKKYNLFREENEGYAKIITEFARLKPDNKENVLETITSIIGAYSVDPNRVLDLLLEVFEYNAIRDESDVYVDFINDFYNSREKITQLIALKLNFYAQREKPEELAKTFYRLVAILIQKELLDIEDIWPYLVPHDAKILDYHKKLVDEAKIISKKYAMAVIGDGEKPPQKSVFESLSNEDRVVLEIDNQKVQICGHLIDIGDWDQALMLAKKLPEYFCFSHHRVAASACDLINYLINPLYRECALNKQLNSRIRPISERRYGPKQIRTISELPKRLFPMLTALGPFLSVDTLLLHKVIRILKYSLLSNGQTNSNSTNHTSTTDLESNPLYYQILDVLNDSVLPSVSLSGSNTSLARELWSLLKNFKYHIRYKLYHNWKDEGTNPIMLKNRGQVLLRAKHHMKRLSKDLLRFTGRQMGKLCYSNPVIVLNYVLLQIQSYDNLIGLVVDSFRFLTPLALDVLIYCIIECLSDPHKNKKSFDGMALAPWLTNLSNFSANIILRYKVEFSSFLEYIAYQLKSGNSLDLVLLTDLIQKLTGIETTQDITDERVEALMGGDVLRTEGAYFNQAKNTKKPSARLKDALVESKLAMPLCISMAQLRDSLFFNQHDEATPLKLVGKLYDQCQETLVQYGVFLTMALNIEDYIRFLPPLVELLTTYKLDPDSAFFLARPMVFHRIKTKFNQLKEEAAKTIPVEEEGEQPELSMQTLNIKFVEAAKSVIDPIAADVKQSLIEKYKTNNLNAKLFVIFWTLSMSDIEVPLNSYEREIQKLKTYLNDLGKSIDNDTKRKKERERCNNIIQKLKQEQADQIEHTKYIKIYLESEKNDLFCDRTAYDHVYLESRQFVQHCPFARSMLTAYDAIYSARFMLFLHELKVENYPTIICLDRLLCDLTYMIGACTENEASHYGRFLCNILKSAANWHSSVEVYTEQCENFPGSIINIENSEHITYDNYRDICYKWHYRLTRAFTVALESSNYIQIRNALIVMISVIDVYPAIKHFGKGIGMKIEDVRNNEKDNRQDLYALATAYAGKLDEKRPNLIAESNFHHVQEQAVKRKSDSSTSKTKTSQSANNSSSSSPKPHKKVRR